jgi:hypothetical protein
MPKKPQGACKPKKAKKNKNLIRKGKGFKVEKAPKKRKKTKKSYYA